MRARTVELVFFEGCPNHDALEPRVRELVDRRHPEARVKLRRIDSEADARRVRFLGSPTVRVDGRDVEPGAEARDDYGLKWRLYRVGNALAGQPPEAWIRAALDAGGQQPPA